MRAVRVDRQPALVTRVAVRAHAALPRVLRTVVGRLWPSFRSTWLRLKSYHIESHLYTVMRDALGIATPRCYFALSDARRWTFLVVLEDLCGLNRGEPHGFALRDAHSLLCALARFHNASLQSAALRRLADAEGFWRHGGYWFGSKEMRSGVDVQRAIDTLLRAFAANFDEREAMHTRAMAQRLAQCAARLTHLVHRIAPRALVHGDFKISNLFIDDNERVYAIDWQWFGGGTPSADVAYFVYTSILDGELDDAGANACDCDAQRALCDVDDPLREQEREYDAYLQETAATSARRRRRRRQARTTPAESTLSEREHYHYYGEQEWQLMRKVRLALRRSLRRSSAAARFAQYYDALGESRDSMSFAEFERGYRLNVIYFALFCVRCKYAWLTPDIMARYARRPEDGLHLRTVSHMKRLLLRADVMMRHSPSLWFD